MSELPALAIYQTLDDKWDTLPITEVLIEQVQNFCDGFLKGKGLVSMKLQVKQVEVFIPLSSVLSLSHVRLCATPWTAECQASLSITNSRSMLKLMSIESDPCYLSVPLISC